MPIELPARPPNPLDAFGRGINRHAFPLFWSAYFIVVLSAYTLFLVLIV